MTTFQKTPTINYIYPPGKEKSADKPKSSVRKKLIAKTLPDDEELFTVQSANKWMEDANKRPVPKMLFDKFWFENELCILFFFLLSKPLYKERQAFLSVRSRLLF